MGDPNLLWARINEAKSLLIIACSLLFSCGLVGLIIAAGMFGGSGETEVEFSRRIGLWALAGGCASGFLWGGVSLRNIYLLTVPGAVWLVLVLITLPFLLVDLVQPSEGGILHDLLGIWSILMMSVSIMIFPLLGPLVSHAIWNRKGPKQMRVDLCRYWREFKTKYRVKNQKISRHGFTGLSKHIPVFEKIPHAIKIIIATVLLGLMFSFLPSLFL